MILGNRVINPGDLRTTVVLKSRSVSPDSGGSSVLSYSTIATLLAKWTNVHGLETWQASSISAQSPATVLIRFYSGLDPSYAIEKDSILYQIISVDDIQERHEFMELKVQRMVSG